MYGHNGDKVLLILAVASIYIYPRIFLQPPHVATSYWHIQREVYSQAFESIEELFQMNITDMKEVHCVKNVRTLYQSLIREMGGDAFKDASLLSQNMENK